MTQSNMPAVRGGVGQSTSVEQSRAIAEVQAAIVVAQQCPRNVNEATRQMQDAVGRKALADRAFYSFPRGRETVTGPSVYLARELARCWGNIQYGLKELSRDDNIGESEMLVYAWDVQTNTRSESAFIVKHARDRKDKSTGKNVRDPLVELRDIYENNANNGARRLREAIMAVLPQWFVEEAKEGCWTTLRKGEAGKPVKPLPVRISDAIKYFESSYGVTVKRLEARIGRKSDDWTDFDVAQLGVLRTSLNRHETTVDEALPEVVERVQLAELTSSQPQPGQLSEGEAREFLNENSANLPEEVRGMIAAGMPVTVIKQSRIQAYNEKGEPAVEPTANEAEVVDTPVATEEPPARPARGARKPGAAQ